MSNIDKDVLDTMQKEQVDLGVSNETQMNRCEINFYAELLSQFRVMTKNLEELYQTLNMIGAERLTEYFKELTKNYKKEEERQKIKEKISQSHKKSVKKEKKTV